MQALHLRCLSRAHWKNFSRVSVPMQSWGLRASPFLRYCKNNFLLRLSCECFMLKWNIQCNIRKSPAPFIQTIFSCVYRIYIYDTREDFPSAIVKKFFIFRLKYFYNTQSEWFFFSVTMPALNYDHIRDKPHRLLFHDLLPHGDNPL